MKRKLKEELDRLSTQILAQKDMDNLDDLYEASQALYEKLAVLKFIEERLQDVEVDVSKNALATKFEKMASAVIQENTSVPESNPHREDIMVPGMDTIKDLVSEMPEKQTVEDILASFTDRPDLMKDDKGFFEPKAEDLAPKRPISVNDNFGKSLKIDLNDRIAFIKHLFNGNMEDYNRVVSQLSTIDSEDRSLSFIANMVKPEYDSWTDKEVYEMRFIAYIKRRFA